VYSDGRHASSSTISGLAISLHRGRGVGWDVYMFPKLRSIDGHRAADVQSATRRVQFFISVGGSTVNDAIGRIRRLSELVA
jgi:hypothetical protein